MGFLVFFLEFFSQQLGLSQKKPGSGGARSGPATPLRVHRGRRGEKALVFCSFFFGFLCFFFIFLGFSCFFSIFLGFLHFLCFLLGAMGFQGFTYWFWCEISVFFGMVVALLLGFRAVLDIGGK